MRRVLRSTQRSSTVLKSRSTLNPRPIKITLVPWVCGRGRSTALTSYPISKEAYLADTHPHSNRYAQTHPDADPYDLKPLKGFVRTIAYGIDDIYGDPKADEKTVLQYWKDFTAG